jgi:hypothetical protein
MPGGSHRTLPRLKKGGLSEGPGRWFSMGALKDKDLFQLQAAVLWQVAVFVQKLTTLTS